MKEKLYIVLKIIVAIVALPILLGFSFLLTSLSGSGLDKLFFVVSIFYLAAAIAFVVANKLMKTCLILLVVLLIINFLGGLETKKKHGEFCENVKINGKKMDDGRYEYDGDMIYRCD